MQVAGEDQQMLLLLQRLPANDSIPSHVPNNHRDDDNQAIKDMFLESEDFFREMSGASCFIVDLRLVSSIPNSLQVSKALC